MMPVIIFTRQRTRIAAYLTMVLFALIPNAVLARSTDQQAKEAYELVTSGCIAVNNEVPFFKGPPDSVSRTVADDSVKEKRQYNKSEVSTLFGYGKLFIEELKVSPDSVPDELKAVFALSLFEFLSRYGVGERRGNGEYVYGDGLAGLIVRFEKKRLVELKWTCDRD
jgi:hypothetical protein